MKRYNQPVELIIHAGAATPQTRAKAPLRAEKSILQQLEAAGIPIRAVKPSNPIAPPAYRSKHQPQPFRNVVAATKISDTEVNPWDVAHMARAALQDRKAFIEPDFLQEFAINKTTNGVPNNLTAKSFGKDTNNINHDADWPPDKNIVWHLDDAYSQLRKAGENVQDSDALIRIAHLDTGYSATHGIVPGRVKKNKLQRNFVDGEAAHDAHDPLTGGFLKMPGHGTGTLGILAGNTI
ncbi:MAG TPA: hypothetical protein PLL71_13435, partial [Agriterribacter sp.]|nr:hypothetical protein [Agriterribacter sp.]